MLTPEEIGVRLGVGYHTVLILIRSGQIRAQKIGNRYRVEEEDLLAFIEQARRSAVDLPQNDHQDQGLGQEGEPDGRPLAV